MKQFKPRNRHLPPSRALLAEIDGRKEQATWVRRGNEWSCFGATGALKWMKGSIRPLVVKAELARRRIAWEWIVPLFTKPLPPPF